jgi:hypothetical protein
MSKVKNGYNALIEKTRFIEAFFREIKHFINFEKSLSINKKTNGYLSIN